jgi:hypothetical protein
MGEYNIIHIEFLTEATENSGKTISVFQIRLSPAFLTIRDHGGLVGIERKPILAVKLFALWLSLLLAQ